MSIQSRFRNDNAYINYYRICKVCNTKWICSLPNFPENSYESSRSWWQRTRILSSTRVANGAKAWAENQPLIFAPNQDNKAGWKRRRDTELVKRTFAGVDEDDHRMFRKNRDMHRTRNESTRDKNFRPLSVAQKKSERKNRRKGEKEQSCPIVCELRCNIARSVRHSLRVSRDNRGIIKLRVEDEKSTYYYSMMGEEKGGRKWGGNLLPPQNQGIFDQTLLPFTLLFRFKHCWENCV